MDIKIVLLVLISAALLCGCGEGTKLPEVSVTESETVTEAEFDEYLLVRSWTADELLNSIFYCGEFHPLPLKPEENEGFTLSDGMLIFPDGTYAEVWTDKNGDISSIKFDAVSAPMDLFVYGVGFGSRPEDIPEKLGIADAIYGSKEETITYSFYGGGISVLDFVYTDRLLESVYISI